MNKFELSEDVAWGDELTQLQIDKGEGCRKGVEGCRCRIGYRPQDQCPDCREEELRDSWCQCCPEWTCEPNEETTNERETEGCAVSR